ncbi:hypothetical protein GCM10010387_67960 [Streptomyces inusitatus]|uniref:Uncharacterized protein n=1 Tax=Streptomyces inusitatus TaxID=68221 RepID=A0A918QRU5_9ACTN|nr:hypothetical protein GCM10010387_67960 [Streptomyces inusitatus]
MLASTVQFSNNDQPPTTPPLKGEFTGAGIPKTTNQNWSVPSDTQQRARQTHRPTTFHAAPEEATVLMTDL